MCWPDWPANGGVVMITFVPDFVSQACADHSAADDAERHALGLDKVTIYTEHSGEHHEPAAAAELARWRAENPPPQPLSPRWPTTSSMPGRSPGSRTSGSAATSTAPRACRSGCEDVSTYPALLAELADRGWSDADLEALTSGNILRVLQAAEDVADPGFGA